LKEVGFAHWTSMNTDATNESGFTALPGGGWIHPLNEDPPSYLGLHEAAMFWATYELEYWAGYYITDDGYIRFILCHNADRLSVRCIKD